MTAPQPARCTIAAQTHCDACGPERAVDWRARALEAETALFAREEQNGRLIELLRAERDRLDRILRATVAGLCGLDAYDGPLDVDHIPSEARRLLTEWRAEQQRELACLGECYRLRKRAAVWKRAARWYRAEALGADAEVAAVHRTLNQQHEILESLMRRDRAMRAVVEAARRLRDGGYDGPFIGAVTEDLFAALAALDGEAGR